MRELQAAEMPPSLKLGAELLEEFPSPEWGEDAYRLLRKAQIVRSRELTEQEQRFVEAYLDHWCPAWRFRDRPNRLHYRHQGKAPENSAAVRGRVVAARLRPEALAYRGFDRGKNQG